jgi:cytoskeleton protein RodZ
MNETSSSNSSASIGERLAAARERAGVSQAVAAERLHLDPKVIEALEANRFEDLGAPVYVRGHLRRYAEFLGEPADALLTEYQGVRKTAVPPDLTRIPQADRPSDPRKLLGPAIAALLAVALGVAVWWVLQGTGRGSSSAPVATPEPLPPAPTSIEPAPSEAAPDTAPPAPELSATPGVPGAAAPDGATATQAESITAPATVPPSSSPAGAAATPVPIATSPPAEPSQPRPARDVSVQLRFPADSWVEIYDARGRRLFYDIAASGSVQSVTGRGPLRVVLGNASGVAVEVNGRAASIPAAALRGDEARFQVMESGSLVRSR